MISPDLPTPCRRAHDLVDRELAGGLDADETASLETHLGTCDACRQHADGLRAVVGMLRRCQRTQDAPHSLSDRLAAIAGEEAQQPLWLKNSGTGALPSPRRRRRARVLTGSAAVVAAVGMLFTLGLLLAPTVPTVSDAPVSAHREFDLRLGIGPGAQAVNVVLASAQHGRLTPTTALERPQVLTSLDWDATSRAEAVDLLTRATTASVGYSGTQRVTLAGERDVLVADVRVVQQADGPTSVEVLDSRGEVINSGRLPAAQTSAEAAMPPAATIFRTAPGGVIAGQPTVLLEAKRADRTLVARWWLVPELGLVMWNETFDGAGRLVRSSGFHDLRLSSTVAAPPTAVPLQLSSAPTVTAPTGSMCEGGFDCSPELAGFRLVQISSDSPQRPGVVHAVYEKDGVCVTVLQRRGRLVRGSGPAYGVSADRSMLVWQSGQVVYTVTTNAGPSVAQSVASQLPHEAPAGTHPVSRSLSGLARLVGR